jgi:hypothetical protein
MSHDRNQSNCDKGCDTQKERNQFNLSMCHDWIDQCHVTFVQCYLWSIAEGWDMTFFQG